VIEFIDSNVNTMTSMLMKKAMMKQTLAKGFVQRFGAWRRS
jgi:hypothetical protein